MNQKSIIEQVEDLAKIRKAKIAFGLVEPDKEIIASLEKAKEYADIIIVGCKIEGFECKTPANPEEEIARMLTEGEVDGIVRGTIDDFKTFEAYCRMNNLKKEEYEAAPAIVQDSQLRLFFMYPVSNPEGWDKNEKLKGILQIVEYMQSFGIKPRVGILTGERHETYQRKKNIKDGVVGVLNKTYEDAEFIVKELAAKRIEAKNYSIEINSAADDGCNLIVPANGMLGNQIIRSIVFLGGGKLLYGPRIAIPKPYEDNSRNEKDFLNHVKFAVAWANSLKK